MRMTNMSEEIKDNTGESIDGEEPQNPDAEPQAGDEPKKEDSNPKKGIDYAKIAESERLAREKAEKALADLAFKKREAKRNGEEYSEEEEDDKPLTRAEALELLRTEQPSGEYVTRKDLLDTQANLIADKFVGSPEEKNAVIETWKNVKFPSHYSLEQQIKGAYALVNGDKIIGERNEALRALKGREGTSRDSSTTHHDSPKGSEPQMPSDVKGALARQGFVFNSQARRYEKKLANGKLLIKDPKSGKIYQEGQRIAPIGA